MRSEEFDYQQSNITLLKAQLKLVTHERDMLKKDVKRISQERDGAYRHLSLSASPQSSLETSSHHRTNSDTAPTIAKSGNTEQHAGANYIMLKPVFDENNFATVSLAMSYHWRKLNYPYLMLLFQLAITTRARGLKEQCLKVNVNAASEVLVKGGSGFELELVDNN